MIIKAYTLLTISVIGILLVSSTFFINFKYLPLNSTKVGLLLAFSYLGYKSYLWIKLLRTESNKINEVKKDKNKKTKTIFIIEYLILGMIGFISFYFTEKIFLIPFLIIFLVSLYMLIKK
ncbi:hypothetical protein [Lactococcus garvieae]|uniref:hypothetical protein n=1 Tax=Lactococcus garvieae TaxID=1363 RepID=UPI00051FA10C|nr:hypothetical protein [Lactococcus garvieae]MBS4465061.1 hypothetical protein [Lactococcus garvieae]QQB43201.1 hypothetical protein I6H59_00365 [Lactococcus garvieae]QQB45264.1 hypothetical protein I6H59_11515 [Lactococcus garvieae]CEF52372.1 hypothetical protein LGMT14_02300 [Lactococcus garvieae]